MAEPVPERIEFPVEEEAVLKLWGELRAFENCLKQSANKPRYTFYDGPPFATGLPHYGHILAGTIKDTVTRYAHQSGFHVERRFGWDTHGLPVEFEIDKALGIKGPEDVAKMGIAAYNAECRKIVMKYADQWESTIGRLGRWIDFRNDYKTLYPWFMESVWWVFSQLYKKGLVYRGVKVMPYSTACATPLSNFESGQNYKDTTDPAVVVTFPIVGQEDVNLTAWTTTPWTLPSNLALCVHPEKDYVKIKENASGKILIVMELRLGSLYKKATEYEVLDRFKGSILEGTEYTPLFDYFKHMKSRGAFKVLCDPYVTEESGTGMVHQAPYFGEDDHRICLRYGVISKESEIICPVDATGRFDERVTHFAGQYVKDADKEIIKHLKTAGRMLSVASVHHSYPFCWRSETPLIYRAVPSWFVRVEDELRPRLLAANATTHWVPDLVKEKRFGNWLKDARDWAISRNRYWGTPIPLWISDDGEEIVCVESIDHLEKLSGIRVDDLHRETVDGITIPSQKGKGDLRRVPEVFDCWFESGSMPYAQAHYPFEHKEKFESSFPADFIAEGVDQTRGWFYTLIVLGTALFDKAPFKNLIVNGLVLASDGQKMSKRKKNYPDPIEVVNKYGADALRLYLINSPVVRAEFLRFKEEGVQEVLKNVFLPWYNAYRFLVQNCHVFEQETAQALRFELESSPEDLGGQNINVMDKWILSFTQSLVKFVQQEMAAYRLYTVIPRLVTFVENLTNWYVKMNRKRLKSELGHEEARRALTTLFHVMMTLVRLMAPFTPFLTEYMYQNLRKMLTVQPPESESVHYLMRPKVCEELIDEVVERRVESMQEVVETGRWIRDKRTVPLKYPLPQVTVVSNSEASLEELKSMEGYILGELNVKSLNLSTDRQKFGISLEAVPDFKALGLRLRGDAKKVTEAIKKMNPQEIAEYQRDPLAYRVAGMTLEDGELTVRYNIQSNGPAPSSQANGNASKAKGDSAEKELPSLEVQSTGGGNLIVILDMTPNQDMLDEGVAREVINRIQKLRKKAKLVPTDQITVHYSTASEELNGVIDRFADMITSVTKSVMRPSPVPEGASVAATEITQLKDVQLEVAIVKGKS